jgi:hypothetical protein
MTSAPIDDLDLATIPGPDGASRPGTALAGACLRVDAWSVPAMCRQPLPSAPDAIPDRCHRALPRPIAAGRPVVCPGCGHRYPADRVRYCVLVSRDYLTALQLAPPEAAGSGGTNGR